MGSKSSDLELDLGRYELRRAGRRVKLEKKCMELLILLVHCREQLVSREDIIARLWPSNLFIDAERNTNNIVRKIRRALRDHAAKPRFLETVVGKGYRFIGPMRVIPYEPPSHVVGIFPRLRPSLAVIPLRFLGEVQDDKGLSLGFADALASRLANLEDVEVFPASATLNMPAHETVRETAARLAARFVVHGAIQVSAGGSRLSVELFDWQDCSTYFKKRLALNLDRPFESVDDIAAQVAKALNRPLHQPGPQSRARYSRDPLAYNEFLQGYQRSSSGDPKLLEEATQHLINAVARDPSFALAHANLSFVCAARHFEFDPSREWLDKAEFHCQRALELDQALPEAHVARAFLLWGPSRNFQHIEAITELKRALALQKNLHHAYNRLGTILAHIGLLDHARSIYERGAPFSPRNAPSHSIAQVYLWSGEREFAYEELQEWREENPANRYATYFAAQLAIVTRQWDEARNLLEEAARLAPDEPMVISLQGVIHASLGESEKALECINLACTNPKSFGHAHHTHYQIASIFSLLERIDIAFEWLERSVDTGFACWPFFLKDPCLKNLRHHPRFELLVSSLQAKYPDELGLL